MEKRWITTQFGYRDDTGAKNKIEWNKMKAKSKNKPGPKVLLKPVMLHII